ncbi:MAG: cytochrome C oxidase subunit IV family protein [Litorilinea sp.]
MSEKRTAAYRLSTTIFIVLLVLTVIEYYAGLYFPSTIILLLLALFKAIAVVNYYMHISRLWSQEGGH